MGMIILLITIHTVLILIAIFIMCYVIVIEYQVRNLKYRHSRQEIVNYINNSMQVYVRDEQGNILKHHAYISSFNSDDYTKIIT